MKTVNELIHVCPLACRSCVQENRDVAANKLICECLVLEGRQRRQKAGEGRRA